MAITDHRNPLYNVLETLLQIYWCYIRISFSLLTLIFSSPNPKAQVSFSEQNLSFVHRRRKLFTFSSPEPLDQFQPNLAQSIFG